MAGFQFIHLETYSRKTDPHGRSVAYVLAEAERQPDACLHVENPAPPELVFGIPLPELRALHDQRAEETRVTDAKGKSKKLRIDQHTLATIVASHPGGEPSDVARWERLTVAWMRATYGDALTTVVRHTDEGHPHLHAYILPDGDMRARSFHPGVAAKNQAVAESLAAGDDGKTPNKKGDAAYRAAMRDWQDAYWLAAGLPSGLTRIGPGRRRLSRDGWQAEQAQARRAGLLEERVDLVAQLEATAAQVGATIETGEGRVSELRAEVQGLRAEKQAAIQAAAEALREADAITAEATRQAAAMTVEAEGLLSRARRQASTIINAAKREAEGLRKFGAAVGGLVWGLVGSSPTRVAEVVRAEEREAAALVLGGVQGELRGVRGELRQVRQERDELTVTLQEVAADRDALRARTGNPATTLAVRRIPGA
jgi:hypothetical protein